MKHFLSSSFLASSLVFWNGVLVATELSDVSKEHEWNWVKNTLITTQKKTEQTLSIQTVWDKIHMEEEELLRKIENIHSEVIDFLQINPWADTPEKDREIIREIILKDTEHILTDEEAEIYIDILQNKKVREGLYSKLKHDDIWKIGSLFFVLILSLLYANAYKQQIIDQLKKWLSIKPISFITFGSISGMMVYINGMVPGSAVYLVSFILASLSVGIHKYNVKHGRLQENQLLKEFTDMAPYPIVKYTQDGYPTIWNPDMEAETGYSHEEVIAYYNACKTQLPKEEWRYIIMRFLYQWENLKKVEEYIEILKTGQGYRDITFTLTTKTGEEKTFLWSTLSYINNGDTRTARHLTNVQEIQQELEKTKELLRKDFLTNAYTRHALEKDLLQIFMHNRREKDQKNLIMFFIDIDNFKNINDTYWHAVGDKILQEFVAFIKTHLREWDKIYRYGGDEFILLIESNDMEEITKKINKMRHDFYQLPHGNQINEQSIHVGTSWWSVSCNQINTAHVLKDDAKNTIDGLKNEADSYMYAVKYYRVIKDELIRNNQIKENQSTKNGLGIPQYNKDGEFVWVKVLCEYEDFFITKHQLEKIISLIQTDISLTKRI